MLQFLLPIAFFALASLVVPVLIHLWSSGVGQRVQVGSLRFLEETERRQLRTIRFSQIPLLLLRLAVLAVLVALLTRPVWLDTAPEVGVQAEQWVLVHPEVLEQPIQPETYRRLETLAGSGAAMRLLAPGFSNVDLDESVPDREAAVDVWSLLQEADARLPEGSAITVVGSSRVRDFRGARPALRSSVEWVDLEAASPNRWIAAAQWIGTDSVRVRVGMSQPTGTRFVEALVMGKGPLLVEEDGITLEFDTDRTRVTLRPPDIDPHDDTSPIAPSDTTRRIVIVHSPARRDDARYVAAALRAVAEASHQAISIDSTTEIDTVFQGIDVLFWLHEDPPPVPVVAAVEAGLLLISDATGAAWQAVQRRILTDTDGPGAAPLLKQRVAASHRGRVLWRDSAGQPLLERESSGEGRWYRFYSRFHPSAGSLVRNAAFPVWIWALLDEAPQLSPGDRRRLSTAQRMPLQHSGAFAREAKPTATPLHNLLWLVVFALFTLERWIVHSQQKRHESARGG